jgi:hypothetical protein
MKRDAFIFMSLQVSVQILFVKTEMKNVVDGKDYLIYFPAFCFSKMWKLLPGKPSPEMNFACYRSR